VTSSTTFNFRHDQQQNKLTELVQMDFQRHMPWGFWLFSELRCEVIVGFVNIDGIIDRHCVNCLFIRGRYIMAIINWQRLWEK